MCGDDDDLNMLPPVTDLLQVDNYLNDNNGDGKDDLNDNSGIDEGRLHPPLRTMMMISM